MRNLTQFLLFVPLCCLATAAAQDTITKSVVLVAVNGQPPHAQNLLDQMTDFLTQQGVNVKQAEDSSKSRTQLIEVAKTSGAQSLIYFTVSGLAMNDIPRFKAQCFDPDGKMLWEENAGSKLSFSTTAAAKNLGKAMTKKLQPHVGGPGLQTKK